MGFISFIETIFSLSKSTMVKAMIFVEEDQNGIQIIIYMYRQ